MKKKSFNFKNRKTLEEKAKKELEKIPYLNFVYSSFLINIIIIVLILAFQKLLPSEIPLFYGLPRGNQQLTEAAGLIIPNFISLIVTIINSILTILIKSDFLKKSLSLASFMTALLSTITVVKIFLLVGNI